MVLDADSCFHHTAPAQDSGGHTTVPSLPPRCSLECVEGQWRVVGEGGEVVASHPEEEVRFSVSCKFHVFSSKAEYDRWQRVNL